MCLFVKICFWYYSGGAVKVVFKKETSTVDLTGPAAAVDAAFTCIQSNYVSTICHESLELCLPGN